MRYLDVINNSKLKIENEFTQFGFALKKDELFSKLNFILSSSSFVNEFQLVDATLSMYIPELKNSDENGIEISIGLFQVRKVDGENTSYTSKIKYDKNGGLIFEKLLFVTSDISTTTGSFVLTNDDYEIMTDDVYSFDIELSKTIDDIFTRFDANIELMKSKLLEMKNCT